MASCQVAPSLGGHKQKFEAGYGIEGALVESCSYPLGKKTRTPLSRQELLGTHRNAHEGKMSYFTLNSKV